MIGKTILHYQILEKLGEGGMGIVFLARDMKLGREVAIKFLPRQIAANAEERQRFEIEARAAAILNHPNIATVHSVEEVEGEMFIVMEYIEGRELYEIIKEIPRQPLPLEEIVEITIQIAEGLKAAHEQGIVHRDIKSNNIMVTPDGQVKITDFGLAKMQGGPRITRLGTTFGTAIYMPPERLQGAEADPRSDIWSLGVICYEMCTGKVPFRGEYEEAIFYSILNESPEPMSSVREIPPALEYVVRKCLEKDPARRYQSAEALVEDLRAYQSGELPSPSMEVTRRHNTGAFAPAARASGVGRYWWLVIGVTCALAVLLAFVWIRRDVSRWLPFEMVPSERHVLVLPFSNVGGDSTRQAFCDGLVETLTSKLTQLEQFHGSLWVVPASEVFRNRILSPSEARQAFGANLVITGSLQRLGETFRLTLNLVEPENLRQLNSAVVDVQASNLSTLQDDAVTNVLQMLNLELNPQSRRVIQAGISPVPDAYNFYLQGLGYLQRYENVANLEAATTLFELAIQQDSTYALAYAGLGEAFWQRYKATRENRWVARAMEASRQAERLDPRLPEVNISLGMILAGTGRYREAIASFQQALDVDPTNAAAYRGLARAHEALGDVNRAEVIYHRAIQFKPDYWGGYNDLGVFYFRHGWYEKAIHQFRRVVELTPDNPRGHSNLGGVYYQLKRWTEARQMFERSLALKKTYRVCSNLATLHYIEGKYARAARMYEMALELNRNDYRVWANLASAYQWSGERMEKVQQTYRTAIQLAERERKINPQDVDVVSHLASYYAMIHEDTKALAAIEEALSLAPNDIRVMYRVAGAYEQMGAREQALKWLIKALEQGYSYAEVRHQPELQLLLADERFQTWQDRNHIQ